MGDHIKGATALKQPNAKKGQNRRTKMVHDHNRTKGGLLINSKINGN
jgi:hypothetical protein